MAIRRKKGPGSPAAPPPEQRPAAEGEPKAGKTPREAAPEKPASSPRASSKRGSGSKAVEELDAVGGDVVPTVPVEASTQASPAVARAAVDDAAGSRTDVAVPARDRTGAAPGVTAAHELSPPNQQAPIKPAAAGSARGTALLAGGGQTPGGAPTDSREALSRERGGGGSRPEAGARQPATGIVDPSAHREHTIEQIQPTAERDAPSNSLLSDWDLYLFNEGSHHQLWEKLGSHIVKRGGVTGTNFAVWAPNAEAVSVIGDFNGWDPRAHRLQVRSNSGIWEGFIPSVAKGTIYKYHIVSAHNGYRVDKADPFAVHQETPPRTASIVWDLEYEWNDAGWMRQRRARQSFEAPMTIYEVHLGSWRRIVEPGGAERPMSYREVAGPLAEYLRKLNFTHVEFLPIMEHPFYGSWGYQCTGFFAPTSRYGTPQDFKYLVDVLHQNGIGVILDWVPSHFPTDEHGLSYFDGTHLYEHADPRKGFHPDWNSLIFNYGRNEVRSFLLSSALYWLGEYHTDGLRVDAVASMLYLDYSRKQGEWIPNEFGGRENVEAISFLRRMNEDVYKVHPDVETIAEESTAWPMVSRPTYVGGLGFGMKWDMGWMHDTLRYFSKDPVHRKFHHNDLTFRMMYAFSENFVLPLSHDEVVHGKGSLIGKMPGDDWQKFANLRLLFAHMYSQPAKKLLFMGAEFGQWREWDHDTSLDWHLLDFTPHAQLQRWVEDLNRTYRDVAALHELDMSPQGFDWIDCCDTEQSIVSLVRKSKKHPDQQVVIVLNFTPQPRQNYAVGVPRGGRWAEILNSDAPLYGGSGQGNLGGVDAVPIPLHGRRWSVTLTLPPLGALFLMNETADADGPSQENPVAG